MVVVGAAVRTRSSRKRDALLEEEVGVVVVIVIVVSQTGQLVHGQVVHDTGAERVAEHVHGRSEAISRIRIMYLYILKIHNGLIRLCRVTPKYILVHGLIVK